MHACCMHACICTCLHTYMHLGCIIIHTCIHTYVRTYMHACLYAHVFSCCCEGRCGRAVNSVHGQSVMTNVVAKTHTYLCIHIYVCHIYHYFHYLSFGGRMFLPLYQTLKTTQGPSSYHVPSLGLQWLAQVACQLLGCDDKVSLFRLFHVRSWTIWWTDTDSFSSDTWIRNTLVSRKP